MSLPMSCTVCFRQFASRRFIIRDSFNVTIGRVIEDCPFCGGRAEGGSGTFDFVGDTVTSFRRLDVVQRRRLETVLTKAKKDELSEPEMLQVISEVAPELAAVMRRARKGQFTYVAMMIFVMLLLTRCGDGSLLTINRTEINILWEEAVAQAEAGSADHNGASQHDKPNFSHQVSGENAPEPPSLKPDNSKNGSQSDP